ncbi:MAG: hypothetical protein ABII21_03385 [bacterium]
MNIVKTFEAGGILASGAVFARELIKQDLSPIVIGIALAVFAFCSIHGTKESCDATSSERLDIGGDDWDGPRSDE